MFDETLFHTTSIHSPCSYSLSRVFSHSIRDREKQLYKQCKKELGLEFLEKDDSVMPDMMIQCLEGLLKAAYRLSPLLTGARLWVTHYYAVMLDGEVCVPWDWNNI